MISRPHPISTDANAGRFIMTDWGAASALFLLALMIRLISLWRLDVWFDEVVILMQLERSFAGIWNFCKLDNFPPLYPWILKVGYIFFRDAHAMRFLTAILGALTVPAAYYLGKTLLDRRLGWALGIACALASGLLYHHQMIRMYSLFTLFSCLSVIGFLRALETNHWRDWGLMALANLLGFYTHLFMSFLLLAQGLLLVWFFRFNWKKYSRAVLSHLPAILPMLLWMIFALQRAQEVRQDFLVTPVTPADLVRVWTFFGTGHDFDNRYLLSFLLNLPILIGLVLSVRSRPQPRPRWSLLMFLIIPIAAVFVISLLGQSIYLKRYFIFLLPVYLALSLAGWMDLPSRAFRRLGLSLVFAALAISTVYYFVEYDRTHAEYGFIEPAEPGVENDGHAPSKMADFLRAHLSAGEVVVHFSDHMMRSFSFFPMIYYSRRSLPEYIYSKDDVKRYFGGQYLQPGDQIRSLQELKPIPSGIWVVSLESISLFMGDNTGRTRVIRMKWLDHEDFPRELHEAGFKPDRTVQFGQLKAIHYGRESALRHGAFG